MICGAFIGALSASATEADFLPIAQLALQKLDATNLDNDWHFTMEVVEGDDVLIVRSDPHRSKYEKRELITVNGKTPDNDRQSEFRDGEVDRVDEIDPEASTYSYMVDATTLKLVQNSDGLATISFLPRVKAMEESRDQLGGTLLLNLQKQQIEQIEIFNTRKLTPAFSVTIDTYRLNLKFQQEQGETVLSKLESEAVGSAGFLKSFDKAVAVTFRDYKRAAR